MHAQVRTARRVAALARDGSASAVSRRAARTWLFFLQADRVKQRCCVDAVRVSQRAHVARARRRETHSRPAKTGLSTWRRWLRRGRRVGRAAASHGARPRAPGRPRPPRTLNDDGSLLRRSNQAPSAPRPASTPGRGSCDSWLARQAAAVPWGARRRRNAPRQGGGLLGAPVGPQRLVRDARHATGAAAWARRVPSALPPARKRVGAAQAAAISL